MTKHPVKVCIRTRPTSNFADDQLEIDSESNSIAVHNAGEAEESVPFNNHQSHFNFTYHHLFHNASQDTVFDGVASEVVQGAVDGINGTIMSYGQTGSGKTFTMIGDTRNYEYRGIAPRALSHIFGEVSARIETEFRVSCTYMELYNERIYDLLNDLSDSDARSDYTIVEEKDGKGIYVRGLHEVVVNSEHDALNLLFSGELARTTAEHALNRHSNRSHAIFTIFIAQKPRSGVSEKVLTSKLHLVDLAGSERLKKTMELGGGLDETLRKESMHINQSLSYLEQCVVALTRKSTSYIPYRQTKLTTILKDALGGNCNTLMLACIWGEAAHLEETISTLRLASRMMRVENEVRAVEVVDPMQLVRKQQQQIKQLKQELLMHDALAERGRVDYDEYTPEQQQEVRNMVEQFVNAAPGDDEDVISFSSVRQMLEICRQFKSIVLETKDKARALSRGIQSAGGDGLGGFGDTLNADGAALPGAEVFDGDVKEEDAVGDMADGGGFSVGVARDDARPASSTLIMGGGSRAEAKADSSPVRQHGSPRRGLGSVGKEDEKDGGAGMSGFGFESPTRPGGADPGSDREYAYTLFKQRDGREKNERVLDARRRVRDMRRDAKDVAVRVNELKTEIDDLAEQIEQRKEVRVNTLRRKGVRDDEVDDIVDEEEFRLMRQQKEVKQSYKKEYEELSGLRGSIAEAQRELDQLRLSMLDDFEAWYDRMQKTGALSPSKSAVADGDEDALDDQEAFEQLEEERIMAKDPDSLAFFQAGKVRRANITQNSASLRQMRRNKRKS